MAEVWVARDDDGSIWGFPRYPKRDIDCGYYCDDGSNLPLDQGDFPEIKPGECRKARIVLEGDE